MERSTKRLLYGGCGLKDLGLRTFDLKSATDRWPLSVIYTLMTCVWGYSLASSIVNSTLGLNTFLVTKPIVTKMREVAFLTGFLSLGE